MRSVVRVDAGSAGVCEDLLATWGVLDHVGIAVRDLGVAAALYGALGLQPGEMREIAEEGVRVLMVGSGSSRIELLQATAADSPIGRFVARHGEGLHHIAVRVESVAEAQGRAMSLGMRLTTHEIRVGAEGHRYFFLHPESTGGVLIEICEVEGAGN